MGSGDLIGVVTITYNSADVLPGFLRSMARQTHSSYMLFVVDNASKDSTLALLSESTDGRLRIIANADNRGVAAGNNQGILAAFEAGCSSVLLLNNDTEFEPELFEKLDSGLTEHDAGMTCPKMMFFDEPQRIWAAGGMFRPLMGYLSYHVGEGEMDNGQYDVTRAVTYVPTCCVLIRKEVFDKVGLMDERYFVYADDVDFMYRALRSGVKLVYLHDAKLLHKVGYLTGGEDSAFSTFYGTRNRIFFLLKHFGVLPTLPWLVVRQAQWLSKLATGKKDRAWYRRKNDALVKAFRMDRSPQFDTTRPGDTQPSNTQPRSNP